MPRLIKKLAQNIFIFLISVGFSFCLFYLFIHPLSLTSFLGKRLDAAIGINNSASVSYNPINQLAMQLDEKEKQLNDKEKTLAEKEALLRAENNPWRNELLLVILGALIVLFILVSLNFYFDRQRRRELEKLEKEKLETI